MIDRRVYIAMVERALRSERIEPLITPVPLRRRSITVALEAEIRALWAAGVERKTIAARLGVSYSAVWRRTQP